MRLHEALVDLGKTSEGAYRMAWALLPEAGSVDPRIACLVCEVARISGSIQGMASILDVMGYAADR